MIVAPPRFTLFPYTTLFRSFQARHGWDVVFRIQGRVRPHHESDPGAAREHPVRPEPGARRERIAERLAIGEIDHGDLQIGRDRRRVQCGLQAEGQRPDAAAWRGALRGVADDPELIRHPPAGAESEAAAGAELRGWLAEESFQPELEMRGPRP